MRHLFVPACVCVMTWSGSTGTGLSLEQFTGETVMEKTVASGHAAPTELASAAESQPSAEIASAETEALPIAVRFQQAHGDAYESRPDIAIDIPPQTGLQYFIDKPDFIDTPADPEAASKPEAAAPKPVAARSSARRRNAVVHRSHEEVCQTLASAAESNDLPTPFLIRLLFQESRFQPDAVSHAGAQGVAQFMPQTATSVGLRNPFDPLEAIPASARLLRGLFDRFGNLGLAAAAYNAGPNRIQKWLAKKGKLPSETRGYVKIITGRDAETWKEASAGISAIKVPRVAPCQDEAGLHAWDGPDHIPIPPPSPLARSIIEIAAHVKNHFAAITETIGDKTAVSGKPASAGKRARKGAVHLAARKGAAVKVSWKSGKSSKRRGRAVQIADAHK